MKVVLITFLYDSNQGGGAANSARRLASGLRDNGIDVVVITTQGPPGLRVQEAEGIKVYYFSPHNLYWVAEKDQQTIYKKVIWQLVDTWNPLVYGEMKNILELEKPDVVHVQKLRGFSPSIWKAAGESGCRKLVQTCRDYELMSPEGTLSGRLGQYALQQTWFLRPYQKLRSRMSAQVQVATAPSAYTLRTLTERGFFPNATHCVVPNTHGFSNAKLASIRKKALNSPSATDSSTLRFLYLGRLEAIKGVDLLCEAFSDTVRHFPDCHLDIIGFGTQEDALRRAYGNRSKIKFHGPLFGEAKHKLLASSDVMVVPSIWPEVFGNVVVEAFAYGKPVIAAKSGGLPELINHGKTGFLVDPDYQEGLQRALNLFASNPQAAPHMAEACFRAAQRFSVESITDHYLAAYDI